MKIESAPNAITPNESATRQFGRAELPAGGAKNQPATAPIKTNSTEIPTKSQALAAVPTMPMSAEKRLIGIQPRMTSASASRIETTPVVYFRMTTTASPTSAAKAPAIAPFHRFLRPDERVGEPVVNDILRAAMLLDAAYLCYAAQPRADDRSIIRRRRSDIELQSAGRTIVSVNAEYLAGDHVQIRTYPQWYYEHLRNSCGSETV
jgi:hypothetical protein